MTEDISANWAQRKIPRFVELNNPDNISALHTGNVGNRRGYFLWAILVLGTVVAVQANRR